MILCCKCKCPVRGGRSGRVRDDLRIWFFDVRTYRTVYKNENGWLTSGCGRIKKKNTYNKKVREWNERRRRRDHENEKNARALRSALAGEKRGKVAHTVSDWARLCCNPPASIGRVVEFSLSSFVFFFFFILASKEFVVWREKKNLYIFFLSFLFLGLFFFFYSFPSPFLCTFAFLWCASCSVFHCRTHVPRIVMPSLFFFFPEGEEAKGEKKQHFSTQDLVVVAVVVLSFCPSLLHRRRGNNMYSIYRYIQV